MDIWRELVHCLWNVVSFQEELRRKVNEYKVLKEKEEEEMKREELERLQFEVEEKQRQAAELISKFRDRVSSFQQCWSSSDSRLL